MPALQISPRGNFGNQILQLLYARAIQSEVPQIELLGQLPAVAAAVREPLIPRTLLPSIRSHSIPPRKIGNLYLNSGLRAAKFQQVPLDVDNFGFLETARNLIPRLSSPVETASKNEILINVRGAETLAATHRDYGPVPVSFYELVCDHTGKDPVFLGQLGNDFYSDLLRQRFPRARFIPSQGLLEDFEAMRQSTYLVLSLSTFSWLAGWFSDATEIFMPLIGFFNPIQRPDAWLLPRNDGRYRYFQFPLREWVASEAQIKALSHRIDVAEKSFSDLEPIRMIQLSSRVAEHKREIDRLIFYARVQVALGLYSRYKL